MTPLVLALALAPQQAAPATPWNPAACRPELDSRFVHEVKPAGDAASPIRRLGLKAAEREGGGKADAAAAPNCLMLAPLPSDRSALKRPPAGQGR